MKPSLPVTPDFAVYGLAETFEGARWLDFWDMCGQRDRLWYVNLAHGDPVTRYPILVVITDAKLPGRPHQGDRLATWPTGIDDAVLGALLGLIHLAFPEDSSGERPPQFWGEVDALERTADLDGPEWQPVETYVAGEPHTFRWRALGGGWVAAADLGHVALGIYGYGMGLTEHELRPVADLGSYSVYGTG